MHSRRAAFTTTDLLSRALVHIAAQTRLYTSILLRSRLIYTGIESKMKYVMYALSFTVQDNQYMRYKVLSAYETTVTVLRPVQYRKGRLTPRLHELDVCFAAEMKSKQWKHAVMLRPEIGNTDAVVVASTQEAYCAHIFTYRCFTQISIWFFYYQRRSISVPNRYFMRHLNSHSTTRVPLELGTPSAWPITHATNTDTAETQKWINYSDFKVVFLNKSDLTELASKLLQVYPYFRRNSADSGVLCYTT